MHKKIIETLVSEGANIKDNRIYIPLNLIGFSNDSHGRKTIDGKIFGYYKSEKISKARPYIDLSSDEICCDNDIGLDATKIFVTKIRIKNKIDSFDSFNTREYDDNLEDYSAALAELHFKIWDMMESGKIDENEGYEITCHIDNAYSSALLAQTIPQHDSDYVVHGYVDPFGVNMDSNHAGFEVYYLSKEGNFFSCPEQAQPSDFQWEIDDYNNVRDQNGLDIQWLKFKILADPELIIDESYLRNKYPKSFR